MTEGVELHIKRVYDEPAPGDGYRVLVDRLWPRGLSKERAAIDLWAKEVAPSAPLRRAFHHEGMPWPDFEHAYRAELAANTAVAALRAALAEHDIATLMYATHDEAHNHTILLRDALIG